MALKFAFALIASLVLAPLAPRIVEAMEWSAAEYRDPENAEIVQAAIGRNDEGFAVRIFRNVDGKVRWVLALPQGSFDKLAMTNRLAAFRVDDNEASDIAVPTSQLASKVYVSGSFVKTIVWHGEGASPTRGSLRNILDGRTLFVRFFLDDGKSVDTTFDLDGAPAAIAAAIGIAVTADPEVAAREQEWDTAILHATTVCLASSRFKECTGELSACIGDTTTLTGARLKACMSRAGFALD